MWSPYSPRWTSWTINRSGQGARHASRATTRVAPTAAPDNTHSPYADVEASLRMTSCVCVTMAASLPSPRMIRVCQTMVVRPRCSGVHSARKVSPSGTAAKKLVLLSMVAVRWPSASAATAVGVQPTALPLPLVFDRPYLLIIRDMLTGEPLMMAWVTNPAKS